MTDKEKPESYDSEMESILQGMLDRDEDISARAVTRLHSTLSAASSITRNPARSKMLELYQAKQDEFRGWRKRLAKRSRDGSAMDMAEKDVRIAELERQVELLTASHVAMLRAVGELGGFAKWAQFFDTYKEIREDLVKLGAMPEAKILEVGNAKA
ncbi:MAG: hypothetical protein HYZ46_01615 [Nitrosomonadales bacterium]|nr:hypothetical protein [Nitrosomonadales bacterium]